MICGYWIHPGAGICGYRVIPRSRLVLGEWENPGVGFLWVLGILGIVFQCVLGIPRNRIPVGIGCTPEQVFVDTGFIPEKGYNVGFTEQEVVVKYLGGK